jgi:8-oxo-dGTP pyrophosphatase MutT (NUDIX family)
MARGGGSSRRRGARREFSAGGVVVRGDDVVVIEPRGQRAVALPKGHPEPGETPEEAATREVREETGITAEVVDKLGDISYWFQSSGRPTKKTVAFFLFEFRSGNLADHDDEVVDVRWIPLAEARTALTYPGEREMLERALAHLGTQDR